MLEDFALVAALPEYAALLGAHNLPRTQIYDTLVRGVLEEDYGCLVAGRTEVKCGSLCGRTLGSRRRQS